MSICTLGTVARCSVSIEPACSHCSCPDTTIRQASRIVSSPLNCIGTPHTTHCCNILANSKKAEEPTATAPCPWEAVQRKKGPSVATYPSKLDREAKRTGLNRVPNGEVLHANSSIGLCTAE